MRPSRPWRDWTTPDAEAVLTMIGKHASDKP
jgi:hypothetical protein